MSSRQVQIEDVDEFLNSLLEQARAGDGGTLKKIRKQLSKYDEGWTGPEHLELLHRIYPDREFFSVGPLEYPCVVFEAPPDKQIDGEVDSVLGGLPAARVQWNMIERPLFCDLRKQLSRDRDEPLYPGRAFAVTAIDKERCVVSTHYSTYFDALATCDALELELQKAFHDTNGLIAESDDPISLLPSTSCLRRLMTDVEDPIVSGEGRAACMAVSTLLCVKHEGAYCCLVCRRSGEADAGYRRWHVIPAAMFEACGVRKRSEQEAEKAHSIRENILREYLEELFNIREPDSHVDPMWYHKHVVTDSTEPGITYRPVPVLETLLSGPGASLHLTGIVVNVLNLRPEVCTLLLIHDEDWAATWLPRWRLNWEHERDPGTDLRADLIPLADDDYLISEYEEVVGPRHIVASGGVAFWLGVRLARELNEGRQSVIPDRIGNEASEAAAALVKPDEVWVLEWWDGEVPHSYEDDGSAIDQRLVELRESLQFAFIISEHKRDVEVRSKHRRKDPRPVPWSAFDARHRAFLVNVLRHLRNGHTTMLHEKVIGDVASRATLEEIENLEGSPDERNRKISSVLSSVLSELNDDRRLKGALKSFIISVPSMNQYDLVRTDPYCWVRPRDRRSKLERLRSTNTYGTA